MDEHSRWQTPFIRKERDRKLTYAFLRNRPHYPYLVAAILQLLQFDKQWTVVGCSPVFLTRHLNCVTSYFKYRIQQILKYALAFVWQNLFNILFNALCALTKWSAKFCNVVLVLNWITNINYIYSSKILDAIFFLVFLLNFIIPLLLKHKHRVFQFL